MSVLIRIKSIKTGVNNRENYMLLISTENEEIAFSSSILREEKEIGMFLLNKKIKKIRFTLQKQQRDGLTKYAYSQFCLYDFIDIPNKPVTIKKIGLKMYHQETKDNNEAYEDGIFDEYIVISLELKSKRRILKQIQKLSEHISIVTQSLNQPLVTSMQAKSVGQPVYQQINLLSEIQQNPPKDNPINICQSKQKEREEIKFHVQNQMKLTEVIIVKELKKENFPMISIPEVQNNALENISSILPKIQQKYSRSLKKASRQQLSKRPQIFERLPQKDHIGINTNTNTFQIYHMCCGDQIDYSHQLQQSY